MTSPGIMHVPALLPVFSTPAAARQKSPGEAQCRQMIDGMIQTMKETPLNTERDKRDARAVIGRVEKVANENRARGVGECESWGAIAKIVTTQ